MTTSIDMDRLQKQKEEFDALGKLIKSFNRLPPIVDDDYPEMRHYFESALANFLFAMKENGRFAQGNRYKLADVLAASPPPQSVPATPAMKVGVTDTSTLAEWSDLELGIYFEELAASATDHEHTGRTARKFIERLRLVDAAADKQESKDGN